LFSHYMAPRGTRAGAGPNVSPRLLDPRPALLSNNRQLILPRVAALALPAIYQWPTMAEEGGLLGYGPRLERIYSDIVARQVAKVLRGAKPADIPVEQPTKFELVINLKTAKAIGADVSASLVARADKL
jgi:ABC-type uncharacterized transport system substrate-binding protein